MTQPSVISTENSELLATLEAHIDTINKLTAFRTLANKDADAMEALESMEFELDRLVDSGLLELNARIDSIVSGVNGITQQMKDASSTLIS